MYWIKKFFIGISLIKKTLKIINKAKKIPTNKLIIIFLSIFFFKKKQMEVKIINNITKYGEGICFEKKENVNKIGTRNQKIFFLDSIPIEKEKTAKIQKITE